MHSTYAQTQKTAQKKEASTAAAVLDASSQSEGLQRKADMMNNAAQREEAPRPNNTGMPDNLKSGIESLSGFSMDDVRVHYNSSKPATVQALAYTQGTDIHVAPGQEKHLPHEAWHVAQQMAGRVSPTTSINGMPVNDNAGLEHEADVMGEKAVSQRKTYLSTSRESPKFNYAIQLLHNYASQGTRNVYGKMATSINAINGIDKSRHHIIPLSIINNFITTLFRQNQYAPNATSINSFLKHNAQNILDGTNDSVHLGDLNQYIDAAINPNLPNQATIEDILVSCTSWIPWNIFIGPTNRSDDPGNEFEYGAQYIINDYLYEQLDKLYQDLTIYFQGHDANLAGRISMTLWELSELFPNVTAFNISQWIYDPTTRKYHINYT